MKKKKMAQEEDLGWDGSHHRVGLGEEKYWGYGNSWLSTKERKKENKKESKKLYKVVVVVQTSKCSME